MIPLALEFHPVPLARPLEHKHFLIILLVMASPGPESAPPTTPERFTVQTIANGSACSKPRQHGADRLDDD